jgi:hypothetical protein
MTDDEQVRVDECDKKGEDNQLARQFEGFLDYVQIEWPRGGCSTDAP